MNKQIEEMASIIFSKINGANFDDVNDAVIALFNAGYRKQSEGEWISVEDRLPENGISRVLVFLRDDDFTKPIGENKIDTDRYLDGKWVRWSKYVTHWMPLPMPPKMKGGE